MKSWISKALLGLCIAAPATMAELPQKPGRYGGLYLNISSALSSQSAAIRNAFGLWFQNMEWDMSSPNATAYRLVNSTSNPDYVATINFTKVVGVSPKPCNGAISSCAYVVTYNSISGITYKVPTVTFYTQVNIGGVVSAVSTTNKTIFQNAMTSAVGELLEAPYHTYLDDAIGIPAGAACDLADKYAVNAAGRCRQVSGSDDIIHWASIVPVLQLGRYNASGARIGTEFIVNEERSRRYRIWYPSASVNGADYYVLENARAIFTKNQSWASDSRAITLNSGRISVADNRTYNIVYSSCYGPSLVSPFPNITVATVGPDDAGQVSGYISHGAALSNYARNSLASGDYFVPNQSGLACGTNMGYLIDLLDGR